MFNTSLMYICIYIYACHASSLINTAINTKPGQLGPGNMASIYAQGVAHNAYTFTVKIIHIYIN